MRSISPMPSRLYADDPATEFLFVIILSYCYGVLSHNISATFQGLAQSSASCARLQDTDAGHTRSAGCKSLSATTTSIRLCES
jgi:hypothetical protein